MKDKNKKLMIVVASLLLVIGVSFAYFTVSILLKGDGSKVDFTTATLKGSKLVVEGNLIFDDIDMYPGHQNVSSIKVTATGDNELIPYHVIWEGENGLNTLLNYVVYKTSSKVDVSVKCEKEQEVMNGAKMYYEECSIQNVELLGSVVAEGTIGEGKVKEILAKDEFITASPTGEEVYYYVILEYPNLEESQNGDIGNSFKGEVTVSLSETEPDINIIAAYIEQEDGTYKEVSEIPKKGSGYTLNAEKSVCSNGSNLKWDYVNWGLLITNMSQSSISCYLYFQDSPIDMILSSKNVKVRDDFSSSITGDTTGTIYKAEDDDGVSYYFAGNPTDNWIKFAGYYWRIIRINGDGTIRMIYQGTEPNITGNGTHITNAPYVIDEGYRPYGIGFTYENSLQRPSVANGGTPSNIKSVLDSWYQDNIILNENYDEKVAVGKFCNDRNVSSGETWVLSGKDFHYAAYTRVLTYNPTLKCSNSLDVYNTKIGLITADYIMYAGVVSSHANNDYYLYTGQTYYTMTPSRFQNTSGYTGALIYQVNTSGNLIEYYSDNRYNDAAGVRPVINLKTDVQLTGSGTSTDPFVVVGAE